MNIYSKENLIKTLGAMVYDTFEGYEDKEIKHIKSYLLDDMEMRFGLKEEEIKNLHKWADGYLAKDK